MFQGFAQALSEPLSDAADVLRSALVIGCALALILVGPFLPSL